MKAPDAVLFPEEEQIISHAVPARRRDYATVRNCAEPASKGWVTPGSDPARDRRRPTWPTGVQGSMTHCTGYAAAALGLLPQISALGIDAEPDTAPRRRPGPGRHPRRTRSPRRHPVRTGQPELGPVAVQRQRGRLQGMVPPSRGLAGPPTGRNPHQPTQPNLHRPTIPRRTDHQRPPHPPPPRTLDPQQRDPSDRRSPGPRVKGRAFRPPLSSSYLGSAPSADDATTK